MDRLSQWKFIEATAAQRHAVGPEALRKWRVRGVPHRFRLSLVEEADRKHIKLDRSIFDSPPREPANGDSPAQRAG
jgi:hypothetical protein